MRLSTSRVLSTDSNSGFRTSAAPTSASTAVPPRAGLGTVATGWHPTSATTPSAANAAPRNRLSEITGSQRGEDDGADQESDGQHPCRPVDLALKAAARAIPATAPVAASADRSAKARRVRRLNEHA